MGARVPVSYGRPARHSADHHPAEERPLDDDTCHGCGRPANGRTDHNGDSACRDCLDTWAGQDDAAEYRHYAYH